MTARDLQDLAEAKKDQEEVEEQLELCEVCDLRDECPLSAIYAMAATALNWIICDLEDQLN